MHQYVDPDPPVEARFKTLADFNTREEFNKYIIDYTISKLFVKKTPEEAEQHRLTYGYHSRYSRDYDMKYYINDQIVLRHMVKNVEYRLLPNVYKGEGSYYNKDEQTEQSIKDINNLPMDIFLAIVGIEKVIISYKGKSRRQKFERASTDYKEVKAWILGLHNFRFFTSHLYKDLTFNETYQTLLKGTKSDEDIEYDLRDMQKEYLKLYGFDQPWKSNLVKWKSNLTK